MKIAVIVVLYKPELMLLKEVVSSLVRKDNLIILVDNTPRNENSLHDSDFDFRGVVYLDLGENTGIAYAQNKGIEIALKEAADFVVLSDQDTVYPARFFVDIVNAYFAIKVSDPKIGAIGPAYLDQNRPGAEPSFVRYGNGRIERLMRQGGDGAIVVSQLIASGTLIPTEVLKDVGGMQEALFIDWVDMEWCWRAQNKGYRIYGLFDIKIRHRLGDFSKKIGSKVVTVHSPFRNYFIVRNGVYLALHGQLLDKKHHRWHLIRRMVIFFLGMIFISKSKILDVKMMAKGVYDALRGELGPLK